MDTFIIIRVKDQYDDVTCKINFGADIESIDIKKFIDACRAAARAYSFCDELIDKYLPLEDW